MNRWKSIALVAISFNGGVVYATACSDAGKAHAADGPNPALMKLADDCIENKLTAQECGLQIKKLIAPSSPQLKWDFTEREEEESGIVFTSIKLITGNGQVVQIGTPEGHAWDITKENYDTYDIPANAVLACGSSWAGLVELYYLTVQGNSIKVMGGSLDAECADCGGAQYKELGTINNTQ